MLARLAPLSLVSSTFALSLTLIACKPATEPVTPALPPPPAPTACDQLADGLCGPLELPCDELQQVMREHELTAEQCEDSLAMFEQLDADPPLEPELMPLAYARLLVDTLKRSPKASREQLEQLEQIARLQTLPPPPSQAAVSDPEPPMLSELADAWRTYDRANGDPAALAALEGAVEEFLVEHPDHPKALLILSQILLERGRPEDSLRTARHCTEVAPYLADCWLTVGVLEEIEGRTAAAREGYLHYIELSPDGRYADHVRAALERLAR